jgi:RHS repeat-associated protein
VVEEYKYTDIYGKVAVYSCSDSGSTRTLTSESGTVIGNRTLFQGREWDGEASGYSVRHRVYIPAVGRFLNRDPIGSRGDTLRNLLRFVDNSPLNWTDPCGTDPKDVERRKDHFNDDPDIDMEKSRIAEEPGANTNRNCHGDMLGEDRIVDEDEAYKRFGEKISSGEWVEVPCTDPSSQFLIMWAPTGGPYHSARRLKDGSWQHVMGAVTEAEPSKDIVVTTPGKHMPKDVASRHGRALKETMQELKDAIGEAKYKEYGLPEPSDARLVTRCYKHVPKEK